MIKTIPIESERYERLKDYGYTRDSVFEDGRNEDLKALLFGYGGEAAIVAFKDEDKEKIMSRGVFASGKGSLLRRGNEGACHYNAAMNFKNGSCGIMTGYALSDDGVWRMHSWNIDVDGTLIETTEERSAYFGFVLTPEECEVFLSEND